MSVSIYLTCVEHARRVGGGEVFRPARKACEAQKEVGRKEVPEGTPLFLPFHPLINMQMQDTCETSGCQKDSSEEY